MKRESNLKNTFHFHYNGFLTEIKAGIQIENPLVFTW